MNILKFLGLSPKTELDYAVDGFLKFYEDNYTTHFNLYKNENCIIQIVDQGIETSSIQNLKPNNDLFMILTFNKHKNNSDKYLSNFKSSKLYQSAQYIELLGKSYFIGVKKRKDDLIKLISETLQTVYECENTKDIDFELVK